MSWVIENKGRPGNLWNPQAKEFKPMLSGEYKTYQSQQQAMRAASRISSGGVYSVALRKHEAGHLVDSKPAGHLEHSKDPKHDPGKKSVLTSGTNNWAKYDAEHPKR
jgi:hypothetical protein